MTSVLDQKLVDPKLTRTEVYRTQGVT